MRRAGQDGVNRCDTAFPRCPCGGVYHSEPSHRKAAMAIRGSSEGFGENVKLWNREDENVLVQYALGLELTREASPRHGYEGRDIAKLENKCEIFVHQSPSR